MNITYTQNGDYLIPNIVIRKTKPLGHYGRLRKAYVDVLAEFSKDGLLIPKEITWEDGRKYEITRVKDKRRAASTRAGGVGERYTCVVDGKEIFLFYEDNNMWFMERAGA